MDMVLQPLNTKDRQESRSADDLSGNSAQECAADERGNKRNSRGDDESPHQVLLAVKRVQYLREDMPAIVSDGDKPDPFPQFLDSGNRSVRRRHLVHELLDIFLRPSQPVGISCDDQPVHTLGQRFMADTDLVNFVEYLIEIALKELVVGLPALQPLHAHVRHSLAKRIGIVP